MNISNQVGTNYQYLREVINQLNDSRQVLYNSIEKIRNQVNATTNWIGPDADHVKSDILKKMNETESTAKWMNEFTWQLTVLAQKMQERAENG